MATTTNPIPGQVQVVTEGPKSSVFGFGEASQELIIFHNQYNATMDSLLEGGGSSRESLISNLLDEGLGTSLDGTDDIPSSTHSTLGRNDSGVFSSDEAGGQSSSGVIQPADSQPSKKRPKNLATSPNRGQNCAICGKVFSNASALTKHKLTHSDERKHACNMCGKAFKRQDHLNGHMLTHRNKKPFECMAKGCGKSYCDARSLRRHIESRHGQDPQSAMMGQMEKPTEPLTVTAVEMTAVTNPPVILTSNDLKIEMDIDQLAATSDIDDIKLFGMSTVPTQAQNQNQNQPKSASELLVKRSRPSQLHQLLTQRTLTSVGLLEPPVKQLKWSTPQILSLIAPESVDIMKNNKGPTTDDDELKLTIKCTKEPSPISRPISPQLQAPDGHGPGVLKEQLDLIHQIIQQAHQDHDEVHTTTTAENSTKTTSKTPNSKKSTSKSKKSKTSSISSITSATSSSSTSSKVDSPDSKNGEPVECTICTRRFKNTPALNGHMRLHGGYFKKDADGKKKDQSTKETANTPLQTASVSVRALIEEKIIQKRNTHNIHQGVVDKVQGGLGMNLNSLSLSSTTSLANNNSNNNVIDMIMVSDGSSNDLSRTFTDEGVTYQFVYDGGAEADNTDYLLMEEDLFNKVSSICPDSFLNGIDESILQNSSSSPELSGGGIRDSWWQNSQFFGESNSSETFTISSSSGNISTNFKPVPQSPSLDSPSFIYPTPPASLESHNLQSPLFTSTTSSSSTSGSSTTTCSISFPTYEQHQSLQQQNQQNQINSSSIISDHLYHLQSSPPILQHQNSYPAPPQMLLGKREEFSQKSRTPSGSSDLNSQVLTPSSEISETHLKEFKINDPQRSTNSSEDDVFLNPNSVPSSPCLKLPKRKSPIIRNTFASNLRPQTNGGNHFTPYPILSPVRSATGLYWTFSTKLTHVDDEKKKREIPRINCGSNFQAVVPDYCVMKKPGKYPIVAETLLWDPQNVMDTCTDDKIDKYLEFACCSAIPGGGQNKEYALHLLNFCQGDINKAILLLMNPRPNLPDTLKQYKYSENKCWSSLKEVKDFQDSLLKYGKDFVQVAKELSGHGVKGPKSSKLKKISKSCGDCINFYQLWKKSCPVEYERVRNMWKKRDAAFTENLLKTVPPPSQIARRPSETQKNKTCPLVTLGLGLGHQEFPCKVCGKVFNKVKSRSAHMKSHRPPEILENNMPKKSPNCNSKTSPVIFTPTLVIT